MTTANIVIGINGYGGAGKDSIADVLTARYGFVNVSFADLMREMAEALNPIVGIKHELAYDFFKYEDGSVDEEDLFIRYLDAKADVGYDQAKFEYPEFRRTLQAMGTEVGRGLLGEDFWANETMKRIQGIPRVVLSDMRFVNEARAIAGKGGRTWLVDRPDVGPANDHISEVELRQKGWNFNTIFYNDGTLEDLERYVDEYVAAELPWLL